MISESVAYIAHIQISVYCCITNEILLKPIVLKVCDREYFNIGPPQLWSTICLWERLFHNVYGCLVISHVLQQSCGLNLTLKSSCFFLQCMYVTHILKANIYRPKHYKNCAYLYKRLYWFAYSGSVFHENFSRDIHATL